MLKCVCVNLMHKYTIVPKGMYVKEDEEDEEEEKKRIEELQQKERQQIKIRFDLLKEAENKRIYEIMIAHPELYHYSEDENKLELTAAFAELDEEFKGFENYLELLNDKSWVFLYPRINGQGRVIEVGDDEYEGIDDPEPCELKVAKERVKREEKKREDERRAREAERQAQIEEKKKTMKKRKFKAWLEEF